MARLECGDEATDDRNGSLRAGARAADLCWRRRWRTCITRCASRVRASSRRRQHRRGGSAPARAGRPGCPRGQGSACGDHQDRGAVVGARAQQRGNHVCCLAGVHGPHRQRRRRRWHPCDLQRRQLAVLGLGGACRSREGLPQGPVEPGRGLAPEESSGLRELRRFPGSALRQPPRGHRSLERARSVQRALLRRATQSDALCSAAACRIPGDKAREPPGDRARGVARRIQRPLSPRPLRGRDQGLLRRSRGSLLHADDRGRKVHPRSSAGQWRSDAAVARRVRLEQLLASLQDPGGTGLRLPERPGGQRPERLSRPGPHSLCGGGGDLRDAGITAGGLRDAGRERAAQAGVRVADDGTDDALRPCRAPDRRPGATAGEHRRKRFRSRG